MELKILKGVGDKTLNLLKKTNIFSLEDLLNYYPYRYNIIKFFNLNNQTSTDTIYIKSKILTIPKVAFIKKNFNKLSFIATSNHINFNVTIFNRSFLKNNLKINKEIVLHGKYDHLKNTFIASNIIFNIENNRIEPIYHLIAGLKQNVLSKIIWAGLELNYPVLDLVPNYINQKYKFLSKMEALKKIHLPASIEDIKMAKLKLIYEEFFVFMFKVNYLKIINDKDIGKAKIIDLNKEKQFANNLGFIPTKDQLLAFADIKNDMLSKKRMNRLIMGDVGSGKTLVAIYGIYLNFLAGYQSAYMAPTEILASQHYSNLKKILAELNIELITGKMNKKEKNSIKERLINGEIDLLIGTHALISEDIIFQNLGLIITDEQHRFGVNQRKSLENKGINPDVLYLSATPIPRTYALVIYRDTDISIIKTKPLGRKEVITQIKKEDEIKDVLKHVLEEVKKNHQIFVVAPLIENEESELNSVTKLKENFLKVFKNYKIEIIHGAMKQNEKEAIMHDFAVNEIQILISTTVIEVGIDIPNASMMIIFNAERFGLATLHQLRGRIGRGNSDAFCYLISNHDNERLKVMEESSDGFYITEKDFFQRKEGDLFGIRQSGDMFFKIADIKRDLKILLQAQKDCEEYMGKNDYLTDENYLKIINDLSK